MTDFAKQLLAIAVVGFLLVVPATSGDADSKQSEAVFAQRRKGPQRREDTVGRSVF